MLMLFEGPLEMEKENVDPDDDFTDDLFNNLGGSNKESEKSEKSKKRKPQKVRHLIILTKYIGS